MGSETQDTTTWKCDTNPSPVPGLAEELVYGYVAAGNKLPYCVPLPTGAGDSSTSTWMQLGYAVKKMEQAVWAAYYSYVPVIALFTQQTTPFSVGLDVDQKQTLS